jgi:hypothetical protein
MNGVRHMMIHFYLEMVKTTLAPLYREWANNDPFLSRNSQNNSCTSVSQVGQQVELNYL